jgi:nicotinate-nucleotide adenylyltransferase
MILGLDAFLEIDSWKAYRDLFREVPMIVMTRPGSAAESESRQREMVGRYLTQAVSGDYVYSSSAASFLHSSCQPVFIFEVTPIDISSSMIRRKIKKGQSIVELVPKTVERFIRERGLYL